MYRMTEVCLVDQPGVRPGAIVRSIAGRDAGTCYVVLRQVDDRRFAVADGRLRWLDRPKLKNRLHLESLGWLQDDLMRRLERGDRISDVDIERALREYHPRS